ncbi:MAG: hypothetical protein HOP10_01215 [Chitinophagaceae bacterium]|nr:hypothetical protein [Chitinophagaceae bacterium]
MKPTTFSRSRVLLVILIAALTIGLVSWGTRQSPSRYDQVINDTVPKKKSNDRDKKIRDLDDVLDELNAVDMKETMDKAMKEVAEAMKEVDFNKIQKEVEESMAKVDWNKIKEDMANAMKEIDMGKIQKEVQESMAKIDWDKMKAELEKVKEIDLKKVQEEMEKVREEMKDLGPKLEKELANAKEEIEKAKEEIKAFKEFVDGLEKDGLIDKNKDYTLKHKDGELFINGKKATEQTYNKYRSFLEKHKKFSIEKEADDFDIDMD